MGPTVLRVMMRPLFGPSRIRHFTCMASPCIPVDPITSMTSAGVPSSAMVCSRSQVADLFGDLVDEILGLPGLDDRCSSGANLKAACGPDIILFVDIHKGDLLLFTERAEVHHDLFRLNISTNKDQRCKTPLDCLGRLVCPFLDLPGIPCYLKGFERLVLNLFRNLEFYVRLCHN